MFYVTLSTSLANYLLTFKPIRFFAKHNLFFIFFFYLFSMIGIDLYRDYYDDPSQMFWLFENKNHEAIDFKNITGAIFNILFLLGYSYRRHETASGASILLIIFWFPFLIYELYKQITYEYEWFYFIWPLLFDLVVIAIAIVVYAIIADNEKSLK